MKHFLKRDRVYAALIICIILFGSILWESSRVFAAVDAKTVCAAALKATGNTDKLKYKSDKAADFAGFSASDGKKLSSVMYICDEKEVYSICVVRAKNSKGASKILKKFKAYKKANAESDYLGDYSAEEQNVLKNAICGKKGKFAWYIAMSESKSVNKKGQTAIKKSI